MAFDPLPLPQRLALNYAPAAWREATDALFALDTRLAELVAKANEPLLAQLRLAWWRDELCKPPTERAKGDPVLDAIDPWWTGEQPALVGLVDGWEQLVGDRSLSEQTIEAFAEGRAGAFAALARRTGEGAAQADASAAGRVWALADFATHTNDAEERAAALRLAGSTAGNDPQLPRALRPLAILRGLARRSIAHGGVPLVGGRRDIFAALRLGMLGR